MGLLERLKMLLAFHGTRQQHKLKRRVEPLFIISY